MQHTKFVHMLSAGMIILSSFWIMSCKQEQSPTSPTGNFHLNQADAEFSEWSTPVNLGPVINSPYVEQAPFLSKNGLSLFFSSNRPGTLGNMDIWVSERADVNSPWGPPHNLGLNVNSIASDNGPTLSSDEHWLYFASSRTGGCGGTDLYGSHRHNKDDNFGWEPAVNLSCVINSPFVDNGPDIFEDDELGIITMYFESNRPGGQGDEDMWASTLQPDGTFGPPILVPNVSSPATDGRPAVRRRDGLEMILGSMRSGGVGQGDLWVSTRSTTLDPWSVPVNLGAINTTFNEGLPCLSFDGLTLFFNSNRPGGFGMGDIYMSTRTKLH